MEKFIQLVKKFGLEGEKLLEFVHVQEASIVNTRSQATKAGEIIPLKILSTDGSSIVDREKPKQEQYGDESLQKHEEQRVKLCEPLN